MRSSKLFKEFSRIHPGIQHFSPNSSRNCYCWVNMLICKLIITCGTHVSGFWQLKSELQSHNLLISSDKWSTHHVGLHTVTEQSLLLSKSSSFIFPFPYSFVFMRFCSDTPCAFPHSHLLQLQCLQCFPNNAYHEKKKEHIYIYIEPEEWAIFNIIRPGRKRRWKDESGVSFCSDEVVTDTDGCLVTSQLAHIEGVLCTGLPLITTFRKWMCLSQNIWMKAGCTVYMVTGLEKVQTGNFYMESVSLFTHSHVISKPVWLSFFFPWRTKGEILIYLKFFLLLQQLWMKVLRQLPCLCFNGILFWLLSSFAFVQFLFPCFNYHLVCFCSHPCLLPWQLPVSH